MYFIKKNEKSSTISWKSFLRDGKQKKVLFLIQVIIVLHIFYIIPSSPSSSATIVYCQTQAKVDAHFASSMALCFILQNSKTISVQHRNLFNFPLRKCGKQNSWEKFWSFIVFCAIFRKTKVFNGKFIIYAFCTLFFHMNNCSECKNGKSIVGIPILLSYRRSRRSSWRMG